MVKYSYQINAWKKCPCSKWKHIFYETLIKYFAWKNYLEQSTGCNCLGSNYLEGNYPGVIIRGSIILAPIVRGQFFWGPLSGGPLSWGQLSWGTIVLGGSCPGGNYPGGNCSGGNCPRTLKNIHQHKLFVLVIVSPASVHKFRPWKRILLPKPLQWSLRYYNYPVLEFLFC